MRGFSVPGAQKKGEPIKGLTSQELRRVIERP